MKEPKFSKQELTSYNKLSSSEEENNFSKLKATQTKSSSLSNYRIKKQNQLENNYCNYFSFFLLIVLSFFLIISYSLFSVPTDFEFYSDFISSNVKQRRIVLFQEQLNEEQIKDFNSEQLRKKENIKLIKYLNISVKIEHDKFIHLKITDRDKKRYEVPKDEILNKDYLDPLVSAPRSDINIKNFKIRIEMTQKKQTGLYKDFSLKIYSEGKENDYNLIYSFTTKKNFLFSDNYINFESFLSTYDIYGFGQREHEFQLKEGIYTIWPTPFKEKVYDDGKGGKNIYGHHPIGLHATAFDNVWMGFVFLNTNCQDIEIKNNIKINNYYKTKLAHKTIGGIIDYYIIIDNSPDNVIRDIRFLLGSPPLPPFWAFGNHQSRWGINNFEQFKNIYDNYVQKEIPIDSLWMDMELNDLNRSFKIDKGNFNDISSFIRTNFSENHMKFVPQINHAMVNNKNDRFVSDAVNRDILIKSGYSNQNFLGKTWDIDKSTIFIDFTNPKSEIFWKKAVESLNWDTRLNGLWLDRNEPANYYISETKCEGEMISKKECLYEENGKYNEEKLSYFPGYNSNNNPHIPLNERSINVNAITYGNNYLYNTKPLMAYYQSKYSYYAIMEKIQKRPFIVSRSTSLGSGKYTFHWGGDNNSKFEDIKYSISEIFNFNIFGIPFTGADIGGFNGDSNEELTTRWYNIGAFYPFCRNHNRKGRIDQYPWSWTTPNDDTAETIIRRDLKIRYSLLRYMYSEFYAISLNDRGSFFMPVMFEYPNDYFSYENIESKVMFGRSFLICVFYEKGKEDKKFIFPNDNFNEFPSGKIIFNATFDQDIKKREKRTVILSGDPSDLPLFLRGGRIIPYQDTFEHFILNTHYLRNERLILIINPNEYLYSEGEIFYDYNDYDFIKQKRYKRVSLSFKKKKLYASTQSVFLDDYHYEDQFLDKIIFWRASDIIRDRIVKRENSFDVTVNYSDDNSVILNADIDFDEDKICIDFSNFEPISIFELNWIEFHIF